MAAGWLSEAGDSLSAGALGAVGPLHPCCTCARQGEGCGSLEAGTSAQCVGGIGRH